MADTKQTPPAETFTAMARKMGMTVSDLADAAPWDAATCARYVQRHAEKARMAGPQWPDAQVASAVRMLMREDLDHEGVVCMARDRIVALLAERQPLVEALQEAYRFITQPRRMDTPAGGPKTATYRAEGYNALTRKLRAAIAKAEGR